MCSLNNGKICNISVLGSALAKNTTLTKLEYVACILAEKPLTDCVRRLHSNQISDISTLGIALATNMNFGTLKCV